VKGRVFPVDGLSELLVDVDDGVEELEVVVVPEALVVLEVAVLVEVDEVVGVVLDPLWGEWPARGSTYCEFPAEPPPPPPATAGPALRSVIPATARRQANARARNRVGTGIEFIFNQRPEPLVFRGG
jgi:hypothetical protein